VSVIMATYNRSDVLPYAIRSALSQSYPNLEVLVIGDACTDDSEEVVASFGDERLLWHNRTENSGSQAGPNNAGLERARGEYVAYHGHDDLWLPTHLGLLVTAMRGAEADFANTMTAMIGPAGSNLRGIAGHASPGEYAPPSSMMHRREAAELIGGWGDYRRIYRPVDHDFKARLFEHGLRYTRVDALTVLKFPASWRPNSYVDKSCHEQADYERRIATQRGLVYRELATTAMVNLFRRSHFPAYEPMPDSPPPGWQTTQSRRVRGLE
jgi:glycosyltransferase involved in cell wall biosynthesis